MNIKVSKNRRNNKIPWIRKVSTNRQTYRYTDIQIDTRTDRQLLLHINHHCYPPRRQLCFVRWSPTTTRAQLTLPKGDPETCSISKYNPENLFYIKIQPWKLVLYQKTNAKTCSISEYNQNLTLECCSWVQKYIISKLSNHTLIQSSSGLWNTYINTNTQWAITEII